MKHKKKNLIKLQNEKESDGYNLDGLSISVFFLTFI